MTAPSADSARSLDYCGAELHPGQIVAFYHPGEGRLFTGVVKLLGKEQLVLGHPTVGDPTGNSHFGLVKGIESPAMHGRPGEVRYTTVVALPDTDG